MDKVAEQVKKMKEQKKEQFQIDRVENTPFAIVTKNNETFVACGRCKGSSYKNYEEAKKAIEDKEWETIMLLISTIIDGYNKNN